MKEIQNAHAAADPREASEAYAASELNEVKDSNGRAKARHSERRKRRPYATK
jgi:hypothetical protein